MLRHGKTTFCGTGRLPRNPQGGRQDGIRGGLAHSNRGDPRRFDGPRYRRPVVDRIGQDRGIRHPCDRESRPRRARRAGPHPRPHARTRRAGRRGDRPAGLLQARRARGADLRRAELRPAVSRARVGRPDRHRHARPRDGPHGSRHAQARLAQDGRARRGRPHARHGLSRRHRKNPLRRARVAPVALLLGHDASCHSGHDPARRARSRVDQDRGARAKRPAGRPGVFRGRPPLQDRGTHAADRRARFSLRDHLLQHQGHGRRPRRAPPLARLRGRPAARRPFAGPAHAHDGKVSRAEIRVSHRDRRRRARSRRRRPRGGDQLRPAQRRRGLHAPHRPYGPRRPQRPGIHLRERPGDLPAAEHGALRPAQHPSRPRALARRGRGGARQRVSRPGQGDARRQGVQTS